MLNPQATLFALALLALGAAMCQEQPAVEFTTGGAPQEARQARKASDITNGLLDLAIIGAKGAQRVAKESRPTLEHLGKTLSDDAKSLGKQIQAQQRLEGAWSSLKKSRGVRGAVQGLKPLATNVNHQYEKLRERTKPLIVGAASRAKPLLNQAKKRRQELLAEHEARQAQLKASSEEKGQEQGQEQSE